MTIKAIAYSAHKALTTASSQPFKRSHVYELFAAAFGYKSHAALTSEALLCPLQNDQSIPDSKPFTPNELTSRLRQLGYPDEHCDSLASVCTQHLLSSNVCCLALDSLISLSIQSDIEQRVSTRAGEDEWEDWEEDGWDDEDGDGSAEPRSRNTASIAFDALKMSPSFVEELESLLGSGSPRAHYLVAVLNRCKKPNPYLYEESKKGRVLTTIEQGWADEYLRLKPQHETYLQHLRAAAKGGVRQAVAELFALEDHSVDWELLKSGDGPIDALLMAEQVTNLEHRKQWLREAAAQGIDVALQQLAELDDEWALTQLAERGELDSVRTLAERAASNADWLEAWTWQYFALLLDEDLTRSTLNAYHEGGIFADQLYDDDMGGPLYASGYEGLSLAPIPREQNRAAQARANEMLSKL